MLLGVNRRGINKKGHYNKKGEREGSVVDVCACCVYILAYKGWNGQGRLGYAQSPSVCGAQLPLSPFISPPVSNTEH